MCPRTGHESPKEDFWIASTLSLALALDGARV
jgi:hypothetical protein